MACLPEYPICLVIGDARRLQFTLRAKTTQIGVSLTGSTFDFRLSERVSGDLIGTNILNYTSGADADKFDMTEIGDGIVSLILPSSVTATLVATKKYLGQFRRIVSGEATTFLFLDVSAKARP